MNKTGSDGEPITLVVKTGGKSLTGKYRFLGNALIVYLSERAKLIECSPDDDHIAIARYWIGQLAGGRDRV
jgi:hypothetical protein